MARLLTGNPDDMADTEEEMGLMTLLLLVTIVIMIFWRNKNKLYPKVMKSGSKLKNKYREGEYC